MDDTLTVIIGTIAEEEALIARQRRFAAGLKGTRRDTAAARQLLARAEWLVARHRIRLRRLWEARERAALTGP